MATTQNQVTLNYLEMVPPLIEGFTRWYQSTQRGDVARFAQVETTGLLAHLVGAFCEEAAAKCLKLYKTRHTGQYRKGSARGKPQWYLKDKDSGDVVYIFVAAAQMPRFCIVGWGKATELKQKATKQNGEYVVDGTMLKPLPIDAKG